MSFFNPHGHFNMHVKGRVFYVKCTGAWNLETMNQYAKESYRLTGQLIGAPWAMLTDVSDWELATKDCEPVLMHLFKLALDNGFCREAVINNKGVIKIQQFNITDTGDPRFERAFFETEAAAIQWLEQQGFSYS